MQKRSNEINELSVFVLFPRRNTFIASLIFQTIIRPGRFPWPTWNLRCQKEEGRAGEGREGEVSKVPTAANIHRDQLLSGQRHDFSAVLTGNSRPASVHVWPCRYVVIQQIHSLIGELLSRNWSIKRVVNRFKLLSMVSSLWRAPPLILPPFSSCSGRWQSHNHHEN